MVITFFILVFTGYPMKFADQIWARWLIDLVGGLGNARILHRVAGALLLIGFTFHFVIYVSSYMWKEHKRTKKSYLRIFLTLPMVMNPSDFKKMGQYLLYLFFLRRRRPQWGRFSLEEKFEYFGVIWGTILLGVTGIFLWDDSLTTRYLPGRALTVITIIHSFESYLALLHVGIVHLANVLLAPGAFPCSPAMFTGNTPAEEMAEIHPAMLDDAEKERLVHTINRTDRDYPSDMCVHQLFSRMARKRPLAAALMFENRRMSYAELDERAGRLAAYLNAKGIGRGHVVGLCVERSFAMIASLLGVLKCGAAYLPLDPEYPGVNGIGEIVL